MIILKEGYEALDKFLKTTLSQVVLGGTCFLFLYKTTTLELNLQKVALFMLAILGISIEILWVAGNIQTFWNNFFRACLSKRVDGLSFDSKKEEYFDIRDITKVWKISKPLVVEIMYVMIIIYLMIIILFWNILIYLGQMAVSLHIG